MERVYENTRFRTRMNLVMAVTAAILGYGGWLLLFHYPATPSADPASPNFVIIIVVAVVGLTWVRFTSVSLNTALWFDVDRRSGQARIGLWRPFGEKAIEARLFEMVDWSYEAARTKTRMPVRRFRAAVGDPPQWVLFELGAMPNPTPVFRQLAPDAVEAYERDIGVID